MFGLGLSELAEKLRAKGLLPEIDPADIHEESRLLSSGKYSNVVKSPGIIVYYFDSDKPMFPLVKEVL